MDIKKVLNEVTKEIEQSSSQQELQNVKVAYLGKKGKITELLKSLKDLSLEEKKSLGSKLNLIRIEVDNLIKNKFNDLKIEEINSKLKNEYLDISFPPPNSIASKVINTGFGATALNTPDNHPARDMHDTFYLDNNKEILLRTHTSPVQVRTMLNGKPPFKIIAPGRTYRCDSDSTHSPMFHQVEGLFINENANMGDLKGTLIEFCKQFFNVQNLKVRFRPSYFPFTEPSAEMDIAYEIVNNKIQLGQGDRWLEILGCGMVNPIVLENCNVDTNIYQGFAFGVGLDRITMLKYGLTDIRSFFSGNLNWIASNGFTIGDF